MTDTRESAREVMMKLRDQSGYFEKKRAEKPMCLDVLNSVHGVAKNPYHDVTEEDIDLIERAVAHIYELDADMALLIEHAMTGQTVNYALMAPHIINFINPTAEHTPELLDKALRLAPHMIAITMMGDNQ